MFNIIKKEFFVMEKKVNLEEKLRVERQLRNELEKVKLNFDSRTRNWPDDVRQEFSKSIEQSIMRTLVYKYL